MKVSYGKGIANHTGPESCVSGSNSTGEALAGEKAGRTLSPEMKLKNRVPTLLGKGEGEIVGAIERARNGLCGVGEPRHARKHTGQESGEPMTAYRGIGRNGKSKDGSRR